MQCREFDMEEVRRDLEGRFNRISLDHFISGLRNALSFLIDHRHWRKRIYRVETKKPS